MCRNPCAAMPSVRLDDLRRALLCVEVPECSCRITLVRVCSLSGGCDRQRKGRRCSCPRLPKVVQCSCPRSDRDRRGCKCPPCPHLDRAALHMRLGFTRLMQLTGCRDPESAWASLLWALEPGRYADRPAPAAGATATTQEDRVALRQLRHSLGLGLWCSGDVLSPGERFTCSEQRASFLRLIGGAA